MNLPNEHRNFLDRTLDYIKNDARMLGLAVAGSCITNTMDEFSDLDFVVVVSEAHYEQVMLERSKIANSLGHLLVSFTGEHVGEPRLLICLYDHPLLHVDLKFVTRSDFQKRIEDPVILWERESVISDEIKKSRPKHPMPDLQWIEDRFWVWIHYMAVKLGRGELFEVIDCLTFIRVIAFGPLSLVTHGQLPRGVRRLEIFAPMESMELKATVATHDRNSCIEAVRASIAFYRKLRVSHSDLTITFRNEAERVAIEYFEKVAAQNGRQS